MPLLSLHKLGKTITCMLGHKPKVVLRTTSNLKVDLISCEQVIHTPGIEVL
jgi:hypothetical protein